MEREAFLLGLDRRKRWLREKGHFDFHLQFLFQRFFFIDLFRARASIFRSSPCLSITTALISLSARAGELKQGRDKPVPSRFPSPSSLRLLSI